MALRASLISEAVIGLVSMLRTSFADWGLAGVSGWGQFSTTWKCWIHLAACSHSVVIMVLFLLLIGADWLALLPQSCLVILWSLVIIDSAQLSPGCSLLSFTRHFLYKRPFVLPGTPFDLCPLTYRPFGHVPGVLVTWCLATLLSVVSSLLFFCQDFGCCIHVGILDHIPLDVDWDI